MSKRLTSEERARLERIAGDVRSRPLAADLATLADLLLRLFEDEHPELVSQPSTINHQP